MDDQTGVKCEKTLVHIQVLPTNRTNHTNNTNRYNHTNRFNRTPTKSYWTKLPGSRPKKKKN